MRPARISKNDHHFFRGKGRFSILLIPLLIPFHRVSAQSVTHTDIFSSVALHVNQITAPDANVYSKVSYDNLNNLDITPGSPSLPVKYVHLIVPRDKNFSDISISTGTAQPIVLTTPVYPVQTPIPNSGGAPPPFVGPDQVIYANSTPYPSSPLVKYISEGYFDGNKHIITVAVYPVQYIPTAASLMLYPTITFSVRENINVPVTMHGIDKIPGSRQSLYDHALTGLIDNPGDIGIYTETGNGGIFKPTGEHVPFYEYVIITSKDLMPTFEELAGWKRRKGLNAGVVDIQDILSDANYASGDLVSNINDNAGKLRQYLLAAYQNGTVYAVLGGDASIIPVRYAAGAENSLLLWGTENAHIPSDAYYTDFNGNWNVDNDVYYGEDDGDHPDFAPEIFVGRMIVSNQKQAANHVYKTIRYERNPGRGDNDYLTRAFFPQADQLQQNDEATIVANSMPYFPLGTVTIWNEIPNANSTTPPPFPWGRDVVKEIAQYYGLVGIFGHGGPWGIAVSSTNINGCPKSHINSTSGPGVCEIAPYDANGLDKLDDYDHINHPYHNYPNIFYTVACETMPYDDEIGIVNGIPHFGDMYTNNSKAGVAAYLGNTRDGFVYTSSQLFVKFNEEIAGGNYSIGVAEGLSKATFYDSWCQKTHALLGCPEMEMWTAKPTEFDRATVSGTGSVTVNTGDGLPATICIISALDNGAAYQEVQTGSSVTFTGVPDPYAVCITRHDYLPYLWPKNVPIVNHIFTGTAYVGTDDITSGSGLPATGPTVVKSGANVFFHTEGSIVLDQEFTVEPGAAFEAK